MGENMKGGLPSFYGLHHKKQEDLKEIAQEKINEIKRIDGNVKEIVDQLYSKINDVLTDTNLIKHFTNNDNDRESAINNDCD